MASKYIALVTGSLLLLSSCFSRSSYMSYDTYAHLDLGTSVSEMESQVGTPYAIHVKSDGSEEYEYIERIEVGNSLVSVNHYYILIREGKIAGKYVKREQPPAYDLIYQDEPNYPGYP
ncbi:MAG: hypothetical protein JSS61_04220 [Verrucomicrobia bacterium]|nr:hypothetical protein [Verrucomicrobiota bacterium]